MNIDPFLETNIKTTPSKQTFESRVGLIGFFLCSFDNTHGLQILFSYPSKLQHKQNEINILKTHCIWKIENIPLRIDLKFSEFVYSAFQLQMSSQEGTPAKDSPIYGIVIKNWKDIENPIATNVFLDFKNTLESKIGSDLELLYKREKLESNPIRKRKYKELVKQTVKIEQELKTTWKNFFNRVSEKLGTFPIEIIPSQANASMVPIETSLCAQDLFKQKIIMRVLSSDETGGLIVILINQSENLRDVLIQVSRRTEFFSESIWEQELGEWPLKEDLILEFPKSDAADNYLIKISSKKTTIDIKSLEVGPISVT
ncbi:MAG: hypothetical protein ACXADY_10930 [Candidatus Hodarchaeales archaeon]|jgi:hypothetical protein